MLSLINRIKFLFNPNLLAIREVLYDIMVQVIQGYIEDDYHKFHSGVTMMSVYKRIDHNKILTNEFCDIMNDIVNTYNLSEEQCREIVKRIDEEDNNLILEIKLLIRSHQNYINKEIK